MVATNFGSPYKWLPKLAAKFWLPNLVLYQTDIGGQKFEPHGSFFTQAWKYSQYACKASFWVNLALSNVWENGPRPPKFPISALFGTKNLASKGNFSHTLESTYNMPVNQVSESDINFFFEKMAQNLQNSGAKNSAHKTHFSHTLENTHNMPVNQVSWAPFENFLRKWPKTCKISNFDLFFVIRNQ